MTTRGREYIEGLAGLWSVAVGFGEKRLVETATRQMAKLPYYHIFSHKTHEPSTLLAEKLVSLAPAGLKHVFFTNSGGEANDTVVKFVWVLQQRASAVPRRRNSFPATAPITASRSRPAA